MPDATNHPESTPLQTPSRPTLLPALRQTLLMAAPHERRRLLEAFIRDQAARALHLDPSRIDRRLSFSDLGFDSLPGVELRDCLEAELGLELSATLLWTYPDIADLSDYLLRTLARETGQAYKTGTAVPESALVQAQDGSESATNEPIAIVGLGCRFPGGANDPEAFWRLLAGEVNAIQEIPENRLPQSSTGEQGTRWAGLLEPHLFETFDAAFFGIAPREAESLDPQQRLLLEVAWETFEDAGLPPERLTGSRTGVFVGLWSQDYAHLVNTQDPAQRDAYCLTGNIASVATGRLAYVLGLQGPCLTVDTACSSSLVAIDLAATSLRHGECDLALAGGVNCILSSVVMDGLARTRALSPDGRCRSFDARANGYVRAEGCGIVLLKRLSAAQRDGDRIRAVIRGSAVNHDGRSTGLTVPNVLSQQEVLQRALEDAGVAPETIGCIEAHGTGTSLGDPIEFEALKAVVGGGGTGAGPCFLGSVKANIGHTESAAGVAGLIKIVLAMQHRSIPRLLHFQSLNPRITLAGTRFVIPAEAQPWSTGAHPRRAGVSSFGISGTNAHVVVEEAPPVFSQTRKLERPALLPLSARTPVALRDLAQGWREALTGAKLLSDMLYTAGVGRTHHGHRLAVVGKGAADLASSLDSFLAQKPCPGLSQGQSGTSPRVVFIFSGQGCQWVGMGRQLLQTESVFTETLVTIDAAICRETGWSVLEELYADAAAARFDQVAVIQPVLFAVGVALAALWRSWGVEPDMVVGHSMGEVAAAHVAGALSLEDAVRVICRRSRLMARVSGSGGMAVVDLSASETGRYLAGLEDQLSIAASNSPRSTVVSGSLDALDTLLVRLEEADIFCRRVKVDVAGHSPQMEPLKNELLVALADIQPRACRVPILSTVTGEITHGSLFDPAYWVRNLREPVRFADAIRQLAASGPAVYLEVSPHPVLSVAIQSMLHLENGVSAGLALASLRRDQPEQTMMLESLGHLYTAGYPVSWRHLYSDGKVVSVPTYPWQRERFWIETPSANGHEPFRQTADGSAHPLLGAASTLAGQAGTRFWEGLIGPSRSAWLTDHRVEDAILLPGAAFLEMAVSAAEGVFGAGVQMVEEVEFRKALTFESGPRRVQMVWTDAGPERASFGIFSWQDGDVWTLHAQGLLHHEPDIATGKSPEIPADLSLQLGPAMTADTFYPWFLERGQNYGRSFQGVQRFQCGTDQALAEVLLPADLAPQAARYILHPALLDGCLQVLLAALHRTGKTAGPTVPIRIRSLRLFWRPETKVRVYTRFSSREAEGDIYIFDADGRLLVEILGVLFQPLGHRSRLSGQDDWLLRVSWERLDLPVANPASFSKPGCWLLLSDETGLAASLALLLEASGERVVQVIPAGQPPLRKGVCRIVDPVSPSGFDEVLQEISNSPLPFRGFVHLWSLSTPQADDVVALEGTQDVTCGSAMHLVQALARRTWPEPPRLRFVTRGALAVERFQETIAVAQAPLWGLARTIAAEYPEFSCTRMDLAPEPSAAEEESLLREFLADFREEELALRPAGRYTARLVRLAPEISGQHDIHHPAFPVASDSSSTANSIREDGTYLVTGGLGGLGLVVAGWLGQKGARHLALLSRRGCTTPEQLAVVARLETAGVRIFMLQADVADPVQMDRALARIRTEMPPLRGIVHAAGLLDDALLPRQDLESLRRVMAPKVAGAWNLHTLTTDDPLDFFVLFSSVATLLGFPGMGNYTAANAFLDALAHLRHTQGRPALSINWGNFAEVGMAAADSNRGERLAHQGLETLSPEQGMQILDDLLAHERSAQVGVAPLDMQKWLESHPQAATSSLMSYLVREFRQGDPARTAGPLQTLLRALPQERQALLLTFVRNQVAQVLRMESSCIDPQTRFNDLGIDSLMGLEVRNRLEAGLGLRLPATLLWTHPDAANLAEHLDSLLTPLRFIPADRPIVSVKHPLRLRLFCLPYGGGDASIFSHWTSQLPPGIEICPIQFPGRGNGSGKRAAGISPNWLPPSSVLSPHAWTCPLPSMDTAWVRYWPSRSPASFAARTSRPRSISFSRPFRHRMRI